MLAGGWELVEMESCKLPQKVASGWTEAMEGYVGADLNPVLYCGTQVVNGTNHLIICKAKSVTAEPREYMASVVLHQDPNDNFSVNFVGEVPTSRE